MENTIFPSLLKRKWKVTRLSFLLHTARNDQEKTSELKKAVPSTTQMAHEHNDTLQLVIPYILKEKFSLAQED